MTQHADAEYEAALAAEDAGERLKLLARDITRTVGRYAIACTYTADTSSGLHFGRLQPNSAALVRLFLSTGQFDVALARVDCQPGSLVVTALKMHPRPATPKVIRQRVRYSSFARWSGDVRRGAVVILVWPKMLRLRFLGFEEVFSMLQDPDGFEQVAGLICGIPTPSVVPHLLSLAGNATGAPRAPNNAKVLVGRLLVGVAHPLGAEFCVKFLHKTSTMDRGCEQFVFRALALHGWMRIGYAVVMMLNRSSAWHAAIPGLVRFVLRVAVLDDDRFTADAISIRGQAQIHEFIKKLYKPCLFWARRLGTYSSTNDSDRIDLMADLFRLEAFVASRDPFPDVWLSSKLPAVLAYNVSMYDTPTLYTVSQSILGHFAFSPVNILAPAIVQLDNMPPSVIALLDRAIEWLHYDRSFATTRGLTSLLQLLLTHDRLGAMNPLWSRIGVVIPAIFQVVTTTTQQLDATTLAVLDAAVTLNFDGFVMALTADSDDLDLLCDEILERDSNGEPTLYVEIQHRLMVHTVEYLAQDPEHPRTLPYSTLQGLYRRCDSPDWAWVLAPLVLSLPEGNDQKLAFAHKCIDLLTRAVDDNPFVTNSHWRQAIEQLRNVV